MAIRRGRLTTLLNWNALVLFFFVSFTSVAVCWTGIADSAVANTRSTELIDAVNAWRVSLNQSVVPASDSLTFVAQLHCDDAEFLESRYRDHHQAEFCCPYYSWSNLGPWTGACFPEDSHLYRAKPQELTMYPETANEAPGIRHGDSTFATAADCVDYWQNERASYGSIINGGWSTEWGAIGCAFTDHRCSCWVGSAPDPGRTQTCSDLPASSAEVCSGGVGVGACVDPDTCSCWLGYADVSGCRVTEDLVRYVGYSVGGGVLGGILIASVVVVVVVVCCCGQAAKMAAGNSATFGMDSEEDRVEASASSSEEEEEVGHGHGGYAKPSPNTTPMIPVMPGMQPRRHGSAQRAPRVVVPDRSEGEGAGGRRPRSDPQFPHPAPPPRVQRPQSDWQDGGHNGGGGRHGRGGGGWNPPPPPTREFTSYEEPPAPSRKNWDDY